jgi:hypothetical protein
MGCGWHKGRFKWRVVSLRVESEDVAIVVVVVVVVVVCRGGDGKRKEERWRVKRRERGGRGGERGENPTQTHLWKGQTSEQTNRRLFSFFEERLLTFATAAIHKSRSSRSRNATAVGSAHSLGKPPNMVRWADAWESPGTRTRAMCKTPENYSCGPCVPLLNPPAPGLLPRVNRKDRGRSSELAPEICGEALRTLVCGGCRIRGSVEPTALSRFE